MKCPDSLTDKQTTTQSAPLDRSVDFSEYMWMGEELEEFDNKVLEECWEEYFMEACFEEMMAEEEEKEEIRRQQEQAWYPATMNNTAALNIDMQALNLSNANQQVSTSKLNPNAPVFVPRHQVVVEQQR